MGKKAKWFSSLKKALSPVSASKKNQEKSKLKNHPTARVPNAVGHTNVDPQPHPHSEKNETFQTDTTATDREVVVEDEAIPSHVASDAIELSSFKLYGATSMEEVAATRIQTVFRGYMARRALRALRGLVRLNLLVQGPVAKRQAMNTLKCMQTLARVQSQIRSRRVRMSEENEALQRQLLQKHVKELEKVQMSDEWNDSARSKEQVEAKLVNKHEAAMRRERALAYAFSHQQMWKNTAKTPNTMFMDPANPSWGWSWLERLMSAKPWEQGEKELNAKRSINAVGEIHKSYARHQLNLDKSSPVSSPRLFTRNRRTLSNATSIAEKITSTNPVDELNKSLQSEKSNRRHSYAGSSVKDDVASLASTPSLPSYMVPTQSAKAKLRLLSPLGLESNAPPTLENVPSGGIPKKRHSYPASPAKPRRHSGPPKTESHAIVEQSSVIGVESCKLMLHTILQTGFCPNLKSSTSSTCTLSSGYSGVMLDSLPELVLLSFAASCVVKK